MGRILVTGATGFIGSHLVEALLAHGDQVRCLVRESSSLGHLQQLDVELAYGDLSVPGDLRPAVAGTDAVYHLAGKTSATTRAELVQVNAAGTGRIARACAEQANPPMLLVASSLAAAGTAPSGRVRHESDPAVPVSHYGRSKRAGELAAVAWARDVPTTIVRPGIVFGERNREMLPVFQCLHRFRLHAVPTFFPPPLSLIHIADLVDIMLRAADRGTRVAAVDQAANSASLGHYFASAPEYPTYAELGRRIAGALEIRHALLCSLPEPALWIAAAMNQLMARVGGRSDSFNVDKIREAVAGSWCSSSEAVRRDLAFESPHSLDARLRQTAQWYREHGWL